MEFIEPPIVYSGNKYKCLDQIIPLFPTHIKGFVDLFCGGGSVSVNTNSDMVYMNDINHFLIDLYRYLYETDTDNILKEISETIHNYKLDGNNRDGYNLLRTHYNTTHNPSDLYVLLVNGFKDQIRFNNKGEFNTSFRQGRRFNEYRKTKLLKFIEIFKQKKVYLTSTPFDQFKIPSGVDFVYLDPPYLITTATYNDGNRGFGNWDIHKEQRLLDYIDNLHTQGFKFALSNVFEHSDSKNELLIDWSNKYNVNYLKTSNKTQGEQRYIRKEVLITNY